MRLSICSRIALLLVACAVLVLSISMVRDIYQRPHWGMHYDVNSGWVFLVEQQSAAASAGLRAGDTVTEVGMLPRDKSAAAVGALLPVSIRRGGAREVLWLSAADQSGPPRRLLAPLLAALVLWLAGAAIGVVRPGQSGSRAGQLFALFALLSALAIVCIAADDYPVSWAQWLLAPAVFAALVTYLWLQRAFFDGDGRCHRVGPEVLLSAQAVMVLALLLAGPRLLGGATGRGFLLFAGLDALGMLAAAHLLTIWRIYHERNRMLRERANIGVLAGMISWLPLIVVAWLPPMAGLVGVELTIPVSPYLGVLSLCVLAIAYPLLVAWSDVAKLETAIRLFAAGLVTGGALLGVFSFAINVLDSLIHFPSDVRTAINIAFSLLALPVFAPLTRCLQSVIEHYLGVDGADYARGCAAITNELLMAVAIPDLVAAVTKFAPACLQLDTMGMWLRGPDRTWRLYQDGAPTGQLQDPPAKLLVDICDRPPEQRGQPLTPPPGLPASDDSLCIPVFVQQDLRGVLVLGKRHAPGPYGAADLSALMGLASQVTGAVQRIDGITVRFGNAPPTAQGAQLSIVGAGG